MLQESGASADAIMVSRLSPPVSSPPLTSPTPDPRVANKRWPIMYTKDMATGMTLIDQHFAAGLTREAAFKLAFPGYHFVASTYNDQLSYWKAHTKSQQEEMGKMRRDEAGKWSRVQAAGRASKALQRANKVASLIAQ